MMNETSPLKMMGADLEGGRIRRAGPEDTGRIVAFRKATFPKGYVQCEPAYITWQTKGPYAHNPSSTHMYEHNGQIAGLLSVLPITVHLNGSPREGMWGLDLMVSAPYRKTGVATALTEYLQAQTEVPMTMNISASAEKCIRKIGWVSPGSMPMFIRPLRVRGLDAKYGFAMRLAGKLVDRPLRRADQLLAGCLTGNTVFSSEYRFGDWADQVWERAAIHYPAICDRTRDAMNWRYLDYPARAGRNPYHICSLRERGDVIGWAVMRFNCEGGVNVATVVDFLCAPGDARKLFPHCLMAAHRQGADYLRVYATAKPITRALRSMLFVPRDSRRKFLLNTRLMRQNTGLPRSEYDRYGSLENWFLTGGESDLDRPDLDL